jgi:hypothetical protein
MNTKTGPPVGDPTSTTSTGEDAESVLRIQRRTDTYRARRIRRWASRGLDDLYDQDRRASSDTTLADLDGDPWHDWWMDRGVAEREAAGLELVGAT